jgi:hypothetical protein
LSQTNVLNFVIGKELSSQQWFIYLIFIIEKLRSERSQFLASQGEKGCKMPSKWKKTRYAGSCLSSHLLQEAENRRITLHTG